MSAEAYLRPRCIECGDCLLWQGARNSAGNPVATIGGRRSIALRRWVYAQAKRQPQPGQRIVTTCGRLDCLSPEHLIAVSSADMNRRIAARGGYSTMACRIARRKNGAIGSSMTMDKARAIRAARFGEGLLLREIAERFGVSEAVASRVCRGERWIDFADPWAALKVAA